MQTPDQNNSRMEESLKAPPALVSALRKSVEAPIFVPPTVDEAILRAARTHFEKPAARSFTWSFVFRWATGFATVLVMIWLAQVFIRSGVESSFDPVLAQEDLNHDGRVDVLDAFALARQLKNAHITDPRLDLNHDGVVDERDVAMIAAQAVTLAKGGHS